MSTPVTVSSFVVKPLDTPDEVRTPDKTRVEVHHLGGFTLGRFAFSPGWRWLTCIKPVAGTESCQVSHVGYAVAAEPTICLEDGTERRIRAGEASTIPLEHDAWVEGDEPFVSLEA